MNTLLSPLRHLRESLREIGAAINAAREFSEANKPRSESEAQSSGIPL